MLAGEYAKQALEFLVHNDAIHLGMFEYVSNVMLVESVVGGNNDSATSNDTIYRLQKGGCVGRQDTNPSQPVLLEIVGQAAGSVCKGLVGTAQRDTVGGDVEDGIGIGLDGGGALKEKSRRKMVNVRWWLRLRKQVAEDGPNARRRPRPRHGRVVRQLILMGASQRASEGRSREEESGGRSRDAACAPAFCVTPYLPRSSELGSERIGSEMESRASRESRHEWDSRASIGHNLRIALSRGLQLGTCTYSTNLEE